MGRRPSNFRQSDVQRAVKAAQAAGLEVGGVEVTRDGTIRVIVGAESKPATERDFANAWDEVL